MGAPVALAAQRPCRRAASGCGQPGPQVDQQGTGVGGEAGGQGVVVGRSWRAARSILTRRRNCLPVRSDLAWSPPIRPGRTPGPTTYELTHLEALEAEAIHIIREVAAEFERPVLLFSGGKDSVVMLHLAEKAFWPARCRSR